MNNSRKKLFFFASILLFLCTYNSFLQAKYVPRAVLIFLDDSEIGPQAVSNSLLTALYQKAGPIIASASLLANIFSEYENMPENAEQIEQTYNLFGIMMYFRPDEALKQQKGIFLKASGFDPTQWIIKEINEDLYLLVPQAYLNLQQLSRNQVEKTIENQQTTDTELKLGLKVNHMKLSNFKDILALKKREKESAEYFIQALSFQNPQTQKQESHIFCVHSDYQSSSIGQPIWVIYMMGHGTMRKQIVGLSFDSFKQLLNFLTKKINCNLLVYSSCYAAGLNAKLIYEDAQSGIQKTYPFAIITQAITEAPVKSLMLGLKVENKNLDLETFYNFTGFLKDAIATEVINYAKVAENLFPSTPGERLKREEGSKVWENVPQIKLPGIEWFSVMASRKEIISIGSILSKTRDPKKPLNIKTFFKTDPKAILLYAINIPFELIIDSKNMEAILSMKPGDATHKLKRISSKTNNTRDIIDWFMKINMLDSFKVFFIESVNNVEKVIIYNKKIPGEISLFDKYKNKAFYKQNNKIYVQEVDEEPEIATINQEEEYQKLLGLLEEKKEPETTDLTLESIEQIKKILEKKKIKGPAIEQIKPESPVDLHPLQSQLQQLTSALKKLGTMLQNILMQ